MGVIFLAMAKKSLPQRFDVVLKTGEEPSLLVGAAEASQSTTKYYSKTFTGEYGKKFFDAMKKNGSVLWVEKMVDDEEVEYGVQGATLLTGGHTIGPEMAFAVGVGTMFDHFSGSGVYDVNIIATETELTIIVQGKT